MLLIPKHEGTEQVCPEYPVLQEQLSWSMQIPFPEHTYGILDLIPKQILIDKSTIELYSLAFIWKIPDLKLLIGVGDILFVKSFNPSWPN